MYNGREKVTPMGLWDFERPFFYDGITYDEYFVELCYFSSRNTAEKVINYKPLRKSTVIRSSKC